MNLKKHEFCSLVKDISEFLMTLGTNETTGTN